MEADSQWNNLTLQPSLTASVRSVCRLTSDRFLVRKSRECRSAEARNSKLKVRYQARERSAPQNRLAAALR
jgi:hypothetical protein